MSILKYSVAVLVVVVVGIVRARADTSLTMKESVQRKLAGRKLKIVTIVADPYVMAQSGDPGAGYEGFIPDLLDLLSKRLGFEYDLYLSPDGRYGIYNNQTGTWNGMIGEIVKWEKTNGSSGADLVAADLSITKLRNVHVDYIKAFQSMGYTALMKKSRNVPFSIDSTFTIFYPLEAGVWICVLVATIAVGLVIWGIYRIQGGSMDNEQSFTLLGSLWFAFTSLQWQGFDRVPRPLGARFLSCVWFAFVTFTLVLYISGLVNYFDWVTKQGSVPGDNIESIEELVESGITIGTINGGSTHAYIKGSKRAELVEMAKHWENEQYTSSMVDSTKAGVERVKKGAYAFILHELTAKYIANRDCVLKIVGEPFGLNSHGFAIPANHPLEEELNYGILELKEMDEIEFLERKWWVGENLCWKNKLREKKRSKVNWGYMTPAQKVTLGMMMVPLVLLTVGIVVSLVLAVVEELLFKHKGWSLSGAHTGGKTTLREENDL